jgi:AcrR family transcriptional regulator
MDVGGITTTRDRLLDAAITLFARQGYASTSVADIHRSCGLSPGSGALYKHFPSKNALLQAAVQRQLERMAVAGRRVDSAADGGPLGFVADIVWDTMFANSDLWRVVFREPEAMPGFADEVWSGVIADAYGRIMVALRSATEVGSAEVQDPEATGAVLMAALVYLPILKILVGRTPGDIDPDRYRQAWVRLARAVFAGKSSC